MGRLACLGNKQANSDYSMRLEVFCLRGRFTAATRDSYTSGNSYAKWDWGVLRRPLHSA